MRRTRLPGDYANHERAESQTVVNVQRKDGHCDADDEKTDENHAHDRQQRRRRRTRIDVSCMATTDIAVPVFVLRPSFGRRSTPKVDLWTTGIRCKTQLDLLSHL